MMLQQPKRMMQALLVTAISAQLLACENQPQIVRHPGAEPATVDVQGGRLLAGFASGPLRYNLDVAGFRIARYPTTRSAFATCIANGACAAPAATTCGSGAPLDEPNYSRDLADDVPVTCVGVETAKAYCGWVGGRLPTLVEWLLAARGTDPQRFAWGKASADCTQHALGGAREGIECPEPAGSTSLVVGLHRAGAARSGMEDVLLTPGELLAGAVDTRFPACGPDRAACVVRGLEPGAIDAVQPVLKQADGSEFSSTAYGFRCVWDN